ncbi:MAG: response regulator transcription factor [Actinomycetota bacterium]
MNKVRIVSTDKQLVNIVNGLLGSGYIITSKNIPDNFSYFQLNNLFVEEEDISDTALLIVDLANLDIPGTFTVKNSNASSDFLQSGKYFEANDYNFLKELQRIQIPKLIIMSIEQKTVLLESLIRYEDVILQKHLEEELLLRVDLILNKYNAASTKNIIAIEDMVINLEKYELTVNGIVVELTFKEFEMLKYLVSNENKVFSRNVLLSKIWGYDFYGGNRTVDVHMRRIRSKLPPSYEQMFKTVRNVGYMFSQKN